MDPLLIKNNVKFGVTRSGAPPCLESTRGANRGAFVCCLLLLITESSVTKQAATSIFDSLGYFISIKASCFLLFKLTGQRIVIY